MNLIKGVDKLKADGDNRFAEADGTITLSFHCTGSVLTSTTSPLIGYTTQYLFELTFITF